MAKLDDGSFEARQELDEGVFFCDGCLSVRETDGKIDVDRLTSLCAECADQAADCASCGDAMTRGALDAQGYCPECAESMAGVAVQNEPRVSQ